MKTNIIYGILLALVTILVGGCSKQPYFEIPRDDSGNALLTQVTQATSDGIKEGEEDFLVSATFKNAKAGDVVFVELLSLQPIGEGAELQLLPIKGTQKEFELSTSLSLDVSYTAAEAWLEQAGDYVVVTFSSANDSATLKIEMESRVL